MAIEKGLYALPGGMAEEPTIEVEVVLSPEEELDMEVMVPFDANLAEYMDEDALNRLATDLMEDVEADIQSRQEWAETFVEGMDIIGMKYEERTEPWENACGVHSSVLAEAAIRFQAESMSETFPAAGPVKTKIMSKPKLSDWKAKRKRPLRNVSGKT
jgi:hypothetical protein